MVYLKNKLNFKSPDFIYSLPCTAILILVKFDKPEKIIGLAIKIRHILLLDTCAAKSTTFPCNVL